MLEVLAASVLLYLNPPDLVIYTDPGQRIESPDRTAAESACGQLRAAGVPLPVPYVIQPLRSNGEGGGQVPDPSKRLSGMLSSCPEDTAAATTRQQRVR
jgi:hypothetical protein